MNLNIKMMLAAAVACGLLLVSAAQGAEIKVLASGAVKEAALELFPQFEKTSGHKVVITWAGTVDIKKRSPPARCSTSSSLQARRSTPS
jgi:ABC-type molybdate transport system substrate-binding protein